MVDVLHVVWQMNPGGIEVLVREMCMRQREFGLRSAIVEIGSTTGQMIEDLKANKFPVYHCPLNPKHSFVRRLSKLFKNIKPRAIHHHAYKTSVMSAMAAKLSGVSCVVETIHNVYIERGLKRSIGRMLYWLLTPLITYRIAVSEGVRQ